MFFGLMTVFICQKINFFAKLVGCGWMQEWLVCSRNSLFRNRSERITFEKAPPLCKGLSVNPCREMLEGEPGLPSNKHLNVKRCYLFA
jgi:hypothetical protein